MERLRRLSIKTPGRITTISHHAGNKQGQSDILNFFKKAQTAAEMCRTAGEILPPSHWGGVFLFFVFLSSHLLNWWCFVLKSDCLNSWQADWWHVAGSLELCSSCSERNATPDRNDLRLLFQARRLIDETSTMFVSQVLWHVMLKSDWSWISGWGQ